jgi:hypothetical protein
VILWGAQGGTGGGHLPPPSLYVKKGPALSHLIIKQFAKFNYLEQPFVFALNNLEQPFV